MEIELVTEGLEFPEGPIAMADGSIILTEIKGQRLTRVTPDGRKETVVETGGGPNGAAIGPDGAIWITNNGGAFQWLENQGLTIPGPTPPSHTGGMIQRYDLKSVYAITFHHLPHPHHECRKHTVQPPMPPMWHWIRDAHYHGKHLVDGTTYDVWGHIHAAHDSEVAVSELHSSRPHYYTRRSLTEHRTTHLIGWATYKPNATWFHVPEVCKNATDDVVGWMDVTEDIKLGGGCAVASESKMELAANADATSLLIAAAFDKAGLTADITKEASACTGGARAGDVFVDGTPVKSAAVFMGGDEFAECKSGGCEITGWRAFSGLCRRFC